MLRKEFLFFAGTGLYFLSGSLMFTPYTPFLKESGVTDSQVFLAYTILHLSKVFFLPFNHRLVARGGEEKIGQLAYVPRMFGIALGCGSAPLCQQPGFDTYGYSGRVCRNRSRL